MCNMPLYPDVGLYMSGGWGVSRPLRYTPVLRRYSPLRIPCPRRFIAPRPVFIDTADIDVVTPPPRRTGVTREIRRDRSIVRIHTAKPKEVRKKTPGERLVEKFLIREKPVQKPGEALPVVRDAEPPPVAANLDEISEVAALDVLLSTQEDELKSDAKRKSHRNSKKEVSEDGTSRKPSLLKRRNTVKTRRSSIDLDLDSLPGSRRSSVVEELEPVKEEEAEGNRTPGLKFVVEEVSVQESPVLPKKFRYEVIVEDSEDNVPTNERPEQKPKDDKSKSKGKVGKAKKCGEGAKPKVLGSESFQNQKTKFPKPKTKVETGSSSESSVSSPPVPENVSLHHSTTDSPSNSNVTYQVSVAMKTTPQDAVEQKVVSSSPVPRSEQKPTVSEKTPVHVESVDAAEPLSPNSKAFDVQGSQETCSDTKKVDTSPASPPETTTKPSDPLKINKKKVSSPQEGKTQLPSDPNIAGLTTSPAAQMTLKLKTDRTGVTKHSSALPDKPGGLLKESVPHKKKDVLSSGELDSKTPKPKPAQQVETPPSFQLQVKTTENLLPSSTGNGSENAVPHISTQVSAEIKCLAGNQTKNVQSDKNLSSCTPTVLEATAKAIVDKRKVCKPEILGTRAKEVSGANSAKLTKESREDGKSVGQVSSKVDVLKKDSDCKTKPHEQKVSDSVISPNAVSTNGKKGDSINDNVTSNCKSHPNLSETLPAADIGKPINMLKPEDKGRLNTNIKVPVVSDRTEEIHVDKLETKLAKSGLLNEVDKKKNLKQLQEKSSEKPPISHVKAQIKTEEKRVHEVSDSPKPIIEKSDDQLVKAGKRTADVAKANHEMVTPDRKNESPPEKKSRDEEEGINFWAFIKGAEEEYIPRSIFRTNSEPNKKKEAAEGTQEKKNSVNKNSESSIVSLQPASSLQDLSSKICTKKTREQVGPGTKALRKLKIGVSKDANVSDSKTNESSTLSTTGKLGPVEKNKPPVVKSAENDKAKTVPDICIAAITTESSNISIAASDNNGAKIMLSGDNVADKSHEVTISVDKNQPTSQKLKADLKIAVSREEDKSKGTTDTLKVPAKPPKKPISKNKSDSKLVLKTENEFGDKANKTNAPSTAEVILSISSPPLQPNALEGPLSNIRLKEATAHLATDKISLQKGKAVPEKPPIVPKKQKELPPKESPIIHDIKPKTVPVQLESNSASGDSSSQENNVSSVDCISNVVGENRKVQQQLSVPTIMVGENTVDNTKDISSVSQEVASREESKSECSKIENDVSTKPVKKGIPKKVVKAIKPSKTADLFRMENTSDVKASPAARGRGTSVGNKSNSDVASKTTSDINENSRAKIADRESQTSNLEDPNKNIDKVDSMCNETLPMRNKNVKDNCLPESSSGIIKKDSDSKLHDESKDHEPSSDNVNMIDAAKPALPSTGKFETVKPAGDTKPEESGKSKTEMPPKPKKFPKIKDAPLNTPQKPERSNETKNHGNNSCSVEVSVSETKKSEPLNDKVDNKKVTEPLKKQVDKVTSADPEGKIPRKSDEIESKTELKNTANNSSSLEVSMTGKSESSNDNVDSKKVKVLKVPLKKSLDKDKSPDPEGILTKKPVEIEPKTEPNDRGNDSCAVEVSVKIKSEPSDDKMDNKKVKVLKAPLKKQVGKVKSTDPEESLPQKAVEMETKTEPKNHINDSSSAEVPVTGKSEPSNDKLDNKKVKAPLKKQVEKVKSSDPEGNLCQKPAELELKSETANRGNDSCSVEVSVNVTGKSESPNEKVDNKKIKAPMKKKVNKVKTAEPEGALPLVNAVPEEVKQKVGNEICELPKGTDSQTEAVEAVLPGNNKVEDTHLTSATSTPEKVGSPDILVEAEKLVSDTGAKKVTCESSAKDKLSPTVSAGNDKNLLSPEKKTDIAGTRSSASSVGNEEESTSVYSSASSDSGFDSLPVPSVASDGDGNTPLANNPALALDEAPRPPAQSIPRFRKYTAEDFQFLKVLGKGSFGKVLLAELRGTDRYYAVKCLKKDVVLEDNDVECTLIERKVLALGTKHPYLCHLFCTFQTESHLLFVLEYLNGGDLMFHIQQSGRFQEPRARFYAAEIVSGLKFLHNKGIIYRDLKLDNILLDYEGHIRIADFGMCKLQIYLDRMADTFCGTPDYMAPEIIKGERYNQCVDWWSFGILLYEMLIGVSPFSGNDDAELFWSICNETPHYPRFLSVEAKNILVALLEKNISKRLGTPECSAGDVRDQPFFRGIDWDALERRELEPPFRPRVQHPLDVQYFDAAFTAERAQLTPVDKGILETMDQDQFIGFSYTNPYATD